VRRCGRGCAGWSPSSASTVEPCGKVPLFSFIRIRQLPDDPEAEELTKFLVVDDVDPGSGEYGVVKWRHLPVVT